MTGEVIGLVGVAVGGFIALAGSSLTTALVLEDP